MSLKHLEQARKKDHIFTITDMAIKKVKLIAVPGFSNEQNLALQQVHKDLLKIAKEENDCKEVMLLQNYDFEFPIKILGTENSVKYSDNIEVNVLKHKSYAGDLIVAHNHPLTNGFSFADIAMFIFEQYFGVFTVITNQGQIYALYKNNNFEYDKAILLLKKLSVENELLKYPNDAERQMKAAQGFIKKCEEVGVGYEKTN